MSRTFSNALRAPSWIAGALVVACVAVLTPRDAFAQGGAPDQSQLVKDLSGRDWLKRFDAASAILGMPASQRDPVTIAAVVREIARLQKLKGHGIEELPASVQDRKAANTYYDNLVDIASESSNPIVIPVLIAAVDDGDSAVGALAQFGEKAMPQLIAALRPSTAPERAGGIIDTFGQMVKSQIPLTDASRASIVDADRRYLSAGHSEVVERAIDLAVILDDASVMSRLPVIAQARSEHDAALKLTDPQNLLRVAAVARAALVKVNGPGPMRSPEVLIADLHSTDWRVARAAAKEILSAPTPHRTPAMVRALVAEMGRLRHLLADAGAERESDCEFCQLMDLAAKADDPALIPVLAKGLDTGGRAVESLVRRGDAAVPAIIDEAAISKAPTYQADALRAFRQMLERNMPISAPSRAGIAAVALKQMSARHASVVESAIGVAALLGDVSAAPRLKEIAEARTMADAKLDLLGIDSAEKAQRLSELSAAAKKALARIK